jgi:hypothetical protein
MRVEEIEVPVDYLWNLEALQFIDLFGIPKDAWLRQLVIAFQNIGIETQGLQPSATRTEDVSAPGNNLVLSALVPYLVDRAVQESKLRDAIAEHVSTSCRRPVLFLLYGQVEQALNQYLERLERVSIRRVLRRLKRVDVINWYNISWSRSSSWAQDPERLITALRSEVEEKLEVPPRSWPHSVVTAVNKRRSTVVFCFRLRWSNWTDYHISTIHQWMSDWGDMPDFSPRHPVVLFLVMEYEAPRQRMVRRLLGLDLKRPHPIHNQMQALVWPNQQRLPTNLLPEMGNVTFEDVEDWILNEVKPPNPPAVIRLATTILDDPELLGGGVPMDRLTDRLNELLIRASLS